MTGPTNFSVDVAAGTTWTSGWLPLGTYTVSEVGAPADHSIAPNPVTIDEDRESVLVTAVNGYRDFHGKLAIAKVETGAAAPNGTYTFNVDGPVDFQTTVAAGQTWISDWLPLGSYAVAEISPTPSTDHTITPNPATLSVDGVTVLVTATNPFPTAVKASEFGKISITKVETGPSAPSGTYAFTITGAGAVRVDAQVAAGTTWTSDDLPLGTYTIVETNGPAGHTIVPNPVVLTKDGQVASVTVTNPYPATLPTTGGGGGSRLLPIAGGSIAVGGLAVLVGRLTDMKRRTAL